MKKIKITVPAGMAAGSDGDMAAGAAGASMPVPGVTRDLLNDYERELYEERAAIMEFDDGQPRSVAETLALASVIDVRGKDDSPLVRAIIDVLGGVEQF